MSTLQGGDGHSVLSPLSLSPHLVKLISDTIPSRLAPAGHLLLKGLQQTAQEGCEWGHPQPQPPPAGPASCPP